MAMLSPIRQPGADKERKSGDARIKELLCERDEQAVEFLQQRYGAYCTTVAMSVTGNRQDAEECVNDTWLRVWNSIPPADPPSLKVYAAKICRCLAIDSRRRSHRKKRDRELETVLDELDEVTPAETADDTFRQTMTDFLRTLEERDRDLFVGRYWYAYTPAVLAEDQGMSRNAVNIRLMRIREQLRQYLRERGYTV